ncbi:hypothetical protein KJE20_14447, partial [Pyrenophora tritici-repentis]
ISDGQGLLRKFKQIKFLVVDEADRLLSEGHFKEMGEILKVLEPDDPATVHGVSLKKLQFREEKPVFIDANPMSQMASKLQEGLIECAGTEKDLYLYSLLMFYTKKRALVFTNSISAVRRITPFLTNLALPALPLHSNMPQKARLRSIERFKERPGSILVATDVAARVHARASDAPKSKKTAFFIRTLDIDRRIVSRLKPRATISKRLADTVIAKEKKHSEDDLRIEKEAKGKRGRGSGRKKKEKEASEMTKAEMQALRAELKSLLSQRINTGVSARYLTSGGIDVDALVAGEGNMEFLGNLDGLGFDDM